MLGAGIAWAGLGACMERPREEILPWVDRPRTLTPGEPVTYATSLELDGYATGLLGKCIDARPVKLEGNPDHPSSLGATTPQDQAAVLELYDPERARTALDRGMPTSRRQIIAGLGAPARPWIVMPPQSSPVIGALLDRWRQQTPGAVAVQQAPLGRRSVYRATRDVFGRPLEPVFDLSRADVVVALDADLVAGMPGALRHAHDLAPGRKPEPGMRRLYVAEPAPTPTGSLADHRAAIAASQIAGLAAEIVSALERSVPGGEAVRSLARSAQLDAPHRRWARAVASDLARHPGRGAVIAGDHQPAGVHVLALLINAALGNLGEAVGLTAPVLLDPLGPTASDLAAALEAGEVDALIIADTDPLRWAPELGGLIERAPRSLHLSRYRDQTSARCRWFLPLAHPLEQWRDGRGHDGTVTLGQPLIRPLFEGATLIDLLAQLAGAPAASDRERLVAHHLGSAADVNAWPGWLRRGLIDGSSSPRLSASPAPGRPALDAVDQALARGRDRAGIEIDRVRSPAIHDGRFARSPWLQELPRPITKLTWGNAASMAPATAERLGVSDGDVVRVEAGARAVEIPAQIVAGHARDALTVEIGYGGELGVDAFRLGGGDLVISGARVRRTGARVELAVTQTQRDQHGREIALAASLQQYRARPDFTAEHRGPLPSLFQLPERPAPQWAMTIDTSVCSGCSACVIACQVENNVPAVGRAGVIANREMHWLRIDTYDDERGEPLHQPMACQHCETAPCEYVCPTYATVHSPDGLNEMIYNRCIGTRFCSNNCPYKVRRFNWFDYTGAAAELVQLGRNPEVTVRGRGVMEKCTYCVQRIRAAEIRARMERREIAAGEVVTACQQACPTGAIQFAALHHDQSPAIRARSEKRAYAALHREGTRPRTMYLARIRNLNPELGT